MKGYNVSLVKKAYEEGSIEALKEKSKHKANIRKRFSEELEQAVVEVAFEELAWAARHL